MLARISALAALAVSLISGCGSTPAPSAAPIVGVIRPAGPTRTLAIAFRVEPASIALHALRESGVTDYLTKRLFNASLGQLDNHGAVQPYLASALPELSSDS